ncbi:MAG: B12-binding domain-containing radical SAM protein [Bacteroidetes bacterium]|nr:B12-binding domain-containing radical SAM protein [Bacteroidota bacterium]
MNKGKFYFIAPKISVEISKAESDRLTRWFNAQQSLRNKILHNWQVSNNIKLKEPNPSLHSPHFGLLTLASLLLENGYNVEYLDQEWLEKKDEWIPTLSKITKDAIAFFIGSITISYPYAVELIKYLKSKSEAKIILGGHHVTYMDIQAIEDGADIVIRGEAESGIQTIANEILINRFCWDNVPNATFLKNGKIYRTQLKSNLNYLHPIFPFDLLDKEQLKLQEIYVFPSRGCKHSCSFCIEGGKYWNGHYQLSLNQIRSNLLSYNNLLDFNFVYLYDSNFGEDKIWTINLCNLLKNEFPNLYFKTLLRLDLVDEELLIAFRDAGIIEVLVGIESGDENIRKLSGKSMSDDYIFEKLILLNKYIPLVKTSWLVGLPYETKETCKKTIDFIEQVHSMQLVSEASCRIASYYPGTHVFEDPEKHEVSFLNFNWKQYHRRCVPPYNLKNLNAQEIYNYYSKAVEKEIQLIENRLK